MAGKTTKKSPFDCAAFYTITSKLSGKAVTACGESEVRMFEPTEEDRQQWKLVAADTGAYRLISKTTGKALDIMLAGENDGAQLHQWKEDISAPTQSWVLEQTQDGSYKIKSAVSGKCMDIVDISMQDDARLQIWEDLDGENQKWMLNALAAPKPARKPRAPKKEATAKTKTVTEKAATVATEKAASPAKLNTAKPAAAAKTTTKALPKTAADKKAKK